MSPFRSAFLIRLLLAFAASSLSLCGQGKTYHLELPAYQTNAGMTLKVPLTLHDASDLAWVKVQINFDPSVIQFASVSSGPLGDQFDFEHQVDGGSLTLDFTRAENLVSGSGHLARIEFATNSGASTDLYSDLAIAKFEIGDRSGVTDLTISNTLILENGSVQVSAEKHLDNTGNGLPDWWEQQHALDPFSTSATGDEDGDLITNVFELAFGGNPNSYNSPRILPVGTVSTYAENEYVSLAFRRRADESDGLTFRLFESTDLRQWNELSIPDLRMETLELGGGMQQITVRSTNPMTGTGSVPKCFLRLDIE